jgi:hypothetical protein
VRTMADFVALVVAARSVNFDRFETTPIRGTAAFDRPSYRQQACPIGRRHMRHQAAAKATLRSDWLLATSL